MSPSTTPHSTLHPGTTPPGPRAAVARAATLALVCAPLALPAEGAAPAPSSPPQELERLDSGVELAWQARRAESLVHGSVHVSAGPHQEQAHEVGLTRLLVDVLTKSGSVERPRAEIDRWLAEHGAALDIALEPDGFALRFQCPPDQLAGALDICSALLNAPNYPDRAIESSKNRLLARLGRTAPATVADRALIEVIGGDDATAARVPHRSDVALLRSDQLHAFHNEHVLAGRVSVALHGAVPEQAATLVADALAALPTEPRPEPDPAPESPDPGSEPSAASEPGSLGSSGSPATGPADAPGDETAGDDTAGDDTAGGEASAGEASGGQATEGVEVATATAQEAAAPTAQARANDFFYDVGDAAHTELRAALAPVGTGQATPETEAALRLFARYHTPPPSAHARPTVASEVAPLISVQYGTYGLDDLLTAGVGVPHELALPGIGGLSKVLQPAASESLDPERLEAARVGLLALLDPADDGLRLAALLSDRRTGRAPERRQAVIEAAGSLGPERVLELVRERTAGARKVTLIAGPAAKLPELADAASLRTDVRQPRGDTAALELRRTLLEALGGGERWAELNTLVVTGQAHLPQLEDPTPVRITRDFVDLNLVIGQEALGKKTLTISTQEASWLRQGEVHTALDPVRHAALRFGEERQFFRLVVALARGREVRLSAEGRRLDLWRGADRFAWIELGPDGLPTAVGHDGDRRVIGEPSRTELSDFEEQDGRLFPTRMVQPAKSSSHVWTLLETDSPIDPGLLVRPGG